MVVVKGKGQWGIDDIAVALIYPVNAGGAAGSNVHRWFVSLLTQV